MFIEIEYPKNNIYIYIYITQKWVITHVIQNTCKDCLIIPIYIYSEEIKK